MTDEKKFLIQLVVAILIVSIEEYPALRGYNREGRRRGGGV